MDELSQERKWQIHNDDACAEALGKNTDPDTTKDTSLGVAAGVMRVGRIRRGNPSLLRWLSALPIAKVRVVRQAARSGSGAHPGDHILLARGAVGDDAADGDRQREEIDT